MTFARRIGLGAALAIAVPLVFALLIFLNHRANTRASHELLDTDQRALSLTWYLRSLVVDMDASVREFRNTHDEENLKTYRSAVLRYPAVLRELEPVLDEGREKEIFGELSRRIAQWRNGWAEPWIQSRPESAQAAVAPGVAREWMNGMRSIFDELAGILRDEVARGFRARDEGDARLLSLLWWVAAGSSLLLLLGTWRVFRLYNRRAGVLFAGISGAEQGEYRPIPLAEDDELGRIAAAFNRMILEVQQRDEAQVEMGRQLAAAAAQSTEARFRSLLETALDIITVIGPDGRFRYQSPALERVLGYRPEELAGQSVFEFIHPDDQARERRALEAGSAGGGAIRNSECRFRHKNGSWRILDVVGRVVQDEKEGPSIVLNVHDVTERKALEGQLLQSQKMEAIGQLAGGVAHDFNNLLTAILGYSELLATEVGEKSPLLESIDEIRKAGERAASLTRQLLAFSRRQILAPTVLDLNALIANLEKMLHRLIGEDFQLITVLDRVIGRVKADPGQIEQIILNLAVNARDAMPKGGRLTIETQDVDLDETYAREHVTVRPGSYVMLAVTDTGEGMSAETKAHMFEPFFTTKGQGKGTGLGLATVYGIVKQSGGYVWVYSERGRGTTFKVYLPRVEGDAEAIEARRPDRAALRGTETILLVEDDESVRTLTRILLEANGYMVWEATGIEDALKAAREGAGPIHLLLTDVVMPEMSGSELAARIVAFRPDIRVLYMSGYTDDAVVRHGLVAEGLSFLQKPFTPDALALKVRQVLGKSAE